MGVAVKRMKTLLGASTVAVLASFSHSSGATVIKHGADFSIDLSGERICLVEPVEQRRDEDCAGLDLSRFNVPKGNSEMTPIAIAVGSPGTELEFAL